MATATMTSTITRLTPEVIPEEKFKPNVRPVGPELSPDPRWRDWRLREQTPAEREQMPQSFPNINSQLREQDLRKISGLMTPPQTPVPFQPRRLQDLKGHKPIRLEFRPLIDIMTDHYSKQKKNHPRKTIRDDEEDFLPWAWFTDMSEGLFARVWEFSADTFGRQCLGGRVDERDWTKSLLQTLPADFIGCASSVARGDPLRHPKPGDLHSYEHLFLAKNERVSLMVGTISKLLKRMVFDDNLFGALKEEAKALMLQDKTTAHTEDGFQRSLSSTSLVMQYLKDGRELESQRFWEGIDGITMNILDLLLPMINFLGIESPLTAWPSMTEVHQNLHDIVAEAAKLSIGLRLSRSTCWIDYPLTGDLATPNHQQRNPSIFLESKNRALELDEQAFSETPQVKGWESRRRDAAEAVRQRWPAHEVEARIRQWESENPKPLNWAHRSAKVQIVLWPSFTSYFPVGQDTAHGGTSNNGEERHTLIPAQVVYYSGKSTDVGESAEDFTLLQHTQKHGGLVRNRLFGHLGHFGSARLYASRLLAFVFVVLLLSVLLQYSPLSQHLISPTDHQGDEITRVGTSTDATMTASAPDTKTLEPSDTTWSSSSTSTSKQGMMGYFFGGKTISVIPTVLVTTTATPDTEIPEHADTTWSSLSTSTSKRGVLRPVLDGILGGKDTSDVGRVGSTPSTTPVTVGAQPEAKAISSEQELKTAKVEAKPPPKSGTSPIITESDWRSTGGNGDQGSVEHPAPATQLESNNSPSPVGIGELIGSIFRGRHSVLSRSSATPLPVEYMTPVVEKKTVIELEQPASSQSTLTSKADVLHAAEEISGNLKSETEGSGVLGWIPFFGGGKDAKPGSSATVDDRGVESSSPSPQHATTTSDWNIEYATVKTHIIKWTNTRVQTYTKENGNLVTVTEEEVRSEEALTPLAKWQTQGL